MFVVARNPSHLELRPMTQLRLLGLSGSLRRASNSTAVLRGLQDALAPTAALDIFSLHGMPLYNEDDDADHAPESVRALRSAIATSDGVIMISPEYNHGMSGGVRAQQQMNETLVSIPARLVLRPQIVIGGVQEKVRDGRLFDQAALRFALAGVDDLLDEIGAAR